MFYLVPTSQHIIPVSPRTPGYDTQRLAVDKHVFDSLKPTRCRFAFLWSHSNGFHKESLHVQMKAHLDKLRQDSSYDDVEIHYVSWDARNHGESARLNENTFSNRYTWMDNAMDTLQVIEEMGLNTDYQSFIGIGHSFGATSMILAEFLYPKSFDGLCVIEPVMTIGVVDADAWNQAPVLGSLKRRDTWSSREEALETLKKRKFWKLFHPDVLNSYVQYGMYDTKEGTIKLKCPREQEYHVFQCSYYDCATAYASLRALSIPVHFLYALQSNFVLPEDARSVTGQSTMVTLKFVKGTHMAPNEDPEDIAIEAKAFTDKVHGYRSRIIKANL
ncbi:Alpha/Beta hydrolase protein [Phycomyces blakesleeanus]|uniref:Alpha/Beta hydrolase protein n=1 Tax=Phycomyces blakesleeanus TaxID=4837 RepID=A0ABR3AHA5_PHYBL